MSRDGLRLRLELQCVVVDDADQCYAWLLGDGLEALGGCGLPIRRPQNDRLEPAGLVAEVVDQAQDAGGNHAHRVGVAQAVSLNRSPPHAVPFLFRTSEQWLVVPALGQVVLCAEVGAQDQHVHALRVGAKAGDERGQGGLAVPLLWLGRGLDAHARPELPLPGPNHVREEEVRGAAQVPPAPPRFDRVEQRNVHVGGTLEVDEAVPFQLLAVGAPEEIDPVAAVPTVDGQDERRTARPTQTGGNRGVEERQHPREVVVRRPQRIGVAQDQRSI
mmetsp:Transcript_75924/g.203415  ORF Transcript_75924/g.203415 Transcript_75924/m.203415 type:complete len:274 (-) Transcript_75924:1126-1947(-)